MEAPAGARERFQTCRWRSGAFCAHADVRPFTGEHGFKADAWCAECSFYKRRRVGGAGRPRQFVSAAVPDWGSAVGLGFGVTSTVETFTGHERPRFRFGAGEE